jgi:glucose/mannose-6-phosphate isomerase
MREIQVLVLRDRGDHPRVAIRMNITEDVLREQTPHVTEVWSEGKTLLARIFSLVALGDWVSLYLAILHGQDPTPVAVIDHLKKELGKV